MADHHKNWVEEEGGLPPAIRKMADEIKKDHPEWSEGRCIASAVNRARELSHNGSTPEIKAKYTAAIVAWEMKKLHSHLH